MVHDDFASGQRFGFGFPGLGGGRPAGVEVGQILTVNRSVGGIQQLKPCRQCIGNHAHTVGIQMEVWIALRMHIAGGPIDLGGFIERGDEACGHEVAIARHDLGVAGLTRQLRKPAALKFGTGAEEQVGAPKLGDQARLRLDLMDVLQCGGGDVDFRLVARQFLGQRPPFRFAGENIQFGLNTGCSQATAGQ